MSDEWPFKKEELTDAEKLAAKQQEVEDMKARFDEREYSHKLLEEAVTRLEKRNTTYRERLLRAFNGHVHAKYDHCEPDCPRFAVSSLVQ